MNVSCVLTPPFQGGRTLQNSLEKNEKRISKFHVQQETCFCHGFDSAIGFGNPSKKSYCRGHLPTKQKQRFSSVVYWNSNQKMERFFSTMLNPHLVATPFARTIYQWKSQTTKAPIFTGGFEGRWLLKIPRAKCLFWIIFVYTPWN